MGQGVKHPRANDRQLRKAYEAELNFWCSWGRHHTLKHPHIKEQYPAGTICFWCQVEIATEVSKFVYMPEMSEAMHRQARKRFERQRIEAVYDGFLKNSSPEADGLVYYMRINQQIKIGYTTNLTQRSRAYPPGTELLAVEPGTKETERERHIKFSRFRKRGREWFVEAPELTEHMSALAEQFGVPEKLMHSYTKHRASGESDA